MMTPSQIAALAAQAEADAAKGVEPDPLWKDRTGEWPFHDMPNLLQYGFGDLRYTLVREDQLDVRLLWVVLTPYGYRTFKILTAAKLFAESLLREATRGLHREAHAERDNAEWNELTHKIKAERDALRAEVERLRDALESIANQAPDVEPGCAGIDNRRLYSEGYTAGRSYAKYLLAKIAREALGLVAAPAERLYTRAEVETIVEAACHTAWAMGHDAGLSIRRSRVALNVSVNVDFSDVIRAALAAADHDRKG